jgi:hypothetical protein
VAIDALWPMVTPVDVRPHRRQRTVSKIDACG